MSAFALCFCALEHPTIIEDHRYPRQERPGRGVNRACDRTGRGYAPPVLGTPTSAPRTYPFSHERFGRACRLRSPLFAPTACCESETVVRRVLAPRASTAQHRQHRIPASRCGAVMFSAWRARELHLRWRVTRTSVWRRRRRCVTAPQQPTGVVASAFRRTPGARECMATSSKPLPFLVREVHCVRHGNQCGSQTAWGECGR
jgi:hypothetical protein